MIRVDEGFYSTLAYFPQVGLSGGDGSLGTFAGSGGFIGLRQQPSGAPQGSSLKGALNIRKELTQLRADNPLISRALDQVQIYANTNDQRFRDLPVSKDSTGNVTIAGSSLRLQGAGLLVSMALGKISIGVGGAVAVSGTGTLQVAGNTARVVDTLRTPATSSDPGNVGEICFDATFAYFCIAPDTWKRVALSAF